MHSICYASIIYFAGIIEELYNFRKFGPGNRKDIGQASAFFSNYLALIEFIYFHRCIAFRPLLQQFRMFSNALFQTVLPSSTLYNPTVHHIPYISHASRACARVQLRGGAARRRGCARLHGGLLARRRDAAQPRASRGARRPRAAPAPSSIGLDQIRGGRRRGRER